MLPVIPIPPRIVTAMLPMEPAAPAMNWLESIPLALSEPSVTVIVPIDPSLLKFPLPS